MVKKYVQKEVPIDDGIDEVTFKLTLLNRSKFNKWEYSHLIVAIGVSVDIINSGNYPLKIIDFGLAIKSSTNRRYVHSLDEFSSLLPVILEPKDAINILLDGHRFSDVLGKYTSEGAFFFVSGETNNHSKLFKSATFNGDKIESQLDILLNGDLGNWTQKDFGLLNLMPDSIDS